MAQTTVKTPDGSGDFMPERLNILVSNGTESRDKAWDDRFTDNDGKTAWPGINAVIKERFPDMVGRGNTLYVNFTNVNPRFGTATQFAQNLEEDVYITIPRIGVPIPPGLVCPSRYDKQQFTNWFKTIVQKTGLAQAGVGPEFSPSGANAPNLRLLEPELVKCGMIWQHFSNGNLRPRVHWSQNPFDHDIDVGDWNGPWILTFRF